MSKYFHELTNDEVEYSIDLMPWLTYQQFDQVHPQPRWCGYPEATMGLMGCWSLIGFKVTGRDYCKDCDCYIKNQRRQGLI
jgi:hypothetical protein